MSSLVAAFKWFVIGFVGLIAVLTIAGLIEALLFGDKTSYAKCNDLASRTEANLKPLFSQASIDGKEYKCGAIIGTPPASATYIHYTLRGPEAPGQTKAQLLAALEAQLVSLGWVKQATSLSDLDYSYSLGSGDQKIGAKIAVYSAKHNLYRLTVGIDHGTYEPAESNTTKPVDIPVPEDEFEKYVPFQIIEPTVLPAGYTAWNKEKVDAAFQDGVITARYTLTGGSGSVEPYIAESESTEQEAAHGGCDQEYYKDCQQVAVGKHGNSIYVFDEGNSLVTIVGETRITFNQLTNPYVEPVISQESAIAVLLAM